MLINQSEVNLSALQTVKISTVLLVWLFRKTCMTHRSGGWFSPVNEHTPRAASARAARAYCHTELSKTVGTIPTYSVYDKAA